MSQIVMLLKPQAVGWRVIEAHDDWAIRFPASEVVVFGQVMEGECRIERDDNIAFDVRAGDFMLMASPPHWTMRSRGAGPPVDFKAATANPRLLLTSSGNPTITRFIAGHFTFATPNADMLANLMLPIIHVRGVDVAASRLGGLLSLLGDEALSDRPGRSLVLDRLLEILLIEALRHRATDRSGTRPDLVKGLGDPQIGAALRVMHEDVRRPWTVATLARLVGMSRSSFAAKFMETVGTSPIEYLATWRMTLAKDALASSNPPMSDVAELAGYQSVSAFSTAFRRATGCSPTTYRQTLAT